MIGIPMVRKSRNKIKNPEFILYYKKEGDKWFMELESSLR